jgi:EpsD family peptidyl-prolyl cis-trans isomerase
MRATLHRGKTKAVPLSLLTGLVLALSACGEKAPGEDAVAVVDGYEITLAELNHELAAGGVQDAENPAARQAALEAIINRKLLAGLASEGELDRTPDFILKEQRMRDVLLADAAVQSLTPAGGGADAEAVEAYIATNLSNGTARTAYAIQALQFSRPRQAEVMDRLEAADTFEAVQAVLQDANIKVRGGNLTWDSATMPTDLVRQLEQLPAGEPFIIPEGNSMVAGVVRQKQTVPLDRAQARPIAEAAVSQQTVRTRVMDWLEQARHSAEIQYGEGFAAPAANGMPAPQPTNTSSPAAQASRS